MKRHCDFCDKILGYNPSVWNTLTTPKSNWEFCIEHQDKIEEELTKLFIKLKTTIGDNSKS